MTGEYELYFHSFNRARARACEDARAAGGDAGDAPGA